MRDKTEPSAPNNSEPSVPFFARFLEGQEKAKWPAQTLKYPSDLDEWVNHYTSPTTDDGNK